MTTKEKHHHIWEFDEACDLRCVDCGERRKANAGDLNPYWRGHPLSEQVLWHNNYALMMRPTENQPEEIERAKELAALGFIQVSRKYRRVEGVENGERKQIELSIPAFAAFREASPSCRQQRDIHSWISKHP